MKSETSAVIFISKVTLCIGQSIVRVLCLFANFNNIPRVNSRITSSHYLARNVGPGHGFIIGSYFDSICEYSGHKLGSSMRNICVFDTPCWDPNVLNASCTNCNCRPCSNRTMKRLYERVPEYNIFHHVIKTSTQRPYIHSPEPKCLRKQGTTNINVILKEQKISSTVITN